MFTKLLRSWLRHRSGRGYISCSLSADVSCSGVPTCGSIGVVGKQLTEGVFAAVFPLISGAMYDKLGTVGATALLAGLTTLMAPLP